MATRKTPKATPAEKDPADRMPKRPPIGHIRGFFLMLLTLAAVTAPHWPPHSGTHEAMSFLGHLLVSGGVLIRVAASLYIGGRENESLITDGPFSLVRNPLYLGALLAATGAAMLTGSIIIASLLPAAVAIYYRMWAAREEAYLNRKFGARYRKYADRVPRWLPERPLWRMPARDQWRGPAEISIRPYFVLRAAMDASVILLAIPLLEALCVLREHGVVPTLLNLP